MYGVLTATIVRSGFRRPGMAPICGEPGPNGIANENRLPLFTQAAARVIAALSIRLSVPSSSSGPQRPQFETRCASATNSSGSATRYDAAAAAFSRYLVVECTGSLSNCGNTSRPNSSIDATTASVDSVLVVGLNVTWSTPMSAHFWIALAQSSGSPTTAKPSAVAFSICAGVASGRIAGHFGNQSGVGMLSSQ